MGASLQGNSVNLSGYSDDNQSMLTWSDFPHRDGIPAEIDRCLGALGGGSLGILTVLNG